MNITREQFKKLAKKHLIALRGYDINETIEIYGVGKLYDEIVELESAGADLRPIEHSHDTNDCEQLCDNPHCEDGIVDRDMYGHPIYCQVCDSHN